MIYECFICDWDLKSNELFFSVLSGLGPLLMPHRSSFLLISRPMMQLASSSIKWQMVYVR